MSQYEHFCEELRLQDDIEQALERAEEGKATASDIKLLAWASGSKYQPKGIQHEME